MARVAWAGRATWGSTWIGMCLATGLLVGATGCGDDSAGGGGAASDAIANWKPGTLGGWTSATAPSGERWNVLLLTLDTTRADRLKCYGWTQESSPNLDAMASEGVLFERARAATPVTLPSHTSILTGLYPFQHGVRNNGTYVVPEDDTTLAELFKQQGYDTGAILAAFPVAEQFGLSQGFDHYDDRFPLSSQRRESDTAQRIAGDVTRLSLEWIDGRGGKPFFLWAHFFDPHFPYAPPEPFRSRFASDPYVGEIAYMDAEIGNLMAGLKSRGLLEKTVILAIADHGESLGEHREVTHSIFVYNATQHVPCILRLPNGGAFAGPKWRGQRVAELVSHVDVIPTLWNAAGLPREALPPLSGRSLLPLVDQKAPGHDWIYAETLVPEQEYGASDLRALETEAWKFIRAPKRELYDMVKDPKELSNLEARETKRADGMAKDLETLLQLEAGGAQVTMDPETIEKLRSLGYLAGASASSKSSGPKPDPKDMIWAYEAVNEARNRAAEHQPEAAIALCDSVLKKHPEDGTAQRIRASCLIRMNRGDEAVAAYDAILAACGGCADELALLRNRAIAAMTANQLDDALARTRALLEAHPKEQGLNLLLGQVLQSKGDLAGARTAILQETTLFPGDVTAIVALADLERARGNMRAAEETYRRALTLHAFNAPALTNLAEILIASDRAVAARGMIEQALAADPLYPAALFRKAWYLAKDGNLEQAIHVYRTALARDPFNASALHNLGNVYRKMGNTKLALDAFQAAVNTGQGSIEAYTNLGICYVELGRLAEGITVWEQCLERFPDSHWVPSIRDNIEKARQQMGANSMRPQ
ncbi:MAG: sulfatase-like hydrolase/transferase [Candidatus Eisenbacteria bacterium]|nr:sulfatase-like hydrolase/transferase [Candidatus Eisenbacteria bacterium]